MKIFGQPPALYLLFFTELWERFGFYMLQALLVLYLSSHLHLSDTETYSLYTIFGSLVYITPVAGGYLAERYLGYQKAILLGGLALALGYMILALPGKQSFFLGLGFIIIGNGLFKPNVSSAVGLLYDRQDTRREGGYTLFYIGINIGSLMPSLISGVIIYFWGWHAGFLAAAVGMWISLAIFYFGRRKYLQGRGATPRQGALSAKASWCFYSTFYPVAIFLLYLVYLGFAHPHFTHIFLNVLAVLIVASVAILAYRQESHWRYKMLASLLMILLSMGFWAVYNQMFSSMMLFASRNMVLHLGGLPITPQMTQFFEPFFLICLGLIFSLLWNYLGKRQINPSYPSKFALSLGIIFVGYFILAWATGGAVEASLISPLWIAVVYFFLALGELFISPIGLAMITVLTPPKWVGMMIGVWFFAMAESYQFTGWLANFASVPASATPAQSLVIYHHAFEIYSVVGLILCGVAFTVRPLIQRLMHR